MSQRVETVLIVDDEEAVCKLLDRALSAAGYVVGVAHSGAQALELVKARTWNAVVIDFDLPDTNGFKLRRNIGELSAAAPPVIFISGQPLPSVPSEPQAEVFLQKPFSIGQALETIQTVLSDD